MEVVINYIANGRYFLVILVACKDQILCGQNNAPFCQHNQCFYLDILLKVLLTELEYP